MRVQYFFTDRKGGISMPPFRSFNVGDHVGDDPKSVAHNRLAVADRAGVPAAQVIWLDQVHSTRIVTVSENPVSDNPLPKPQAAANTPAAACEHPVLAATDGAVTATPGFALTVMAADCVPILAFDESAGVIAVAHAGRNGAAAGIGSELLQHMVSAGAAVDRVQIILGPAICGSCYEVPPQMQVQVNEVLPGSAVSTSRGSSGLDLRLGLQRQFQNLGVAEIEIDSRCTVEDLNLFSYRRDGITGRHAGVIWLTDD